jgi:hypothetical protein
MKKASTNSRNLLDAVHETAQEQSDGDNDIEIKRKKIIAEKEIYEIKEDKMFTRAHK